MEKREIKLSPELIERIEKGEEAPPRPEIQLTPDLVEALIKTQAEKPKKESKLEDVFGIEEASAKCLIELIKTQRINLLTDLTFEEIQALTVAEAYGNYLLNEIGSDLILQLAQIYKELKVSLGRRGRTEIIDLATFTGGIAEVKKGRLPSLLPSIR